MPISKLNIELREDKMTDHKIIQKFLTSKLQDKLDDTDKSGITEYTLIPVIWGGRDSVNNILKAKAFYEKTKFTIDFGTSSLNCFLDLLNKIELEKIEHVTINSFDLIE